jgi:membrane-bound ClpP family serine protease
MVFVSGELWSATSTDGSIPSGQPVRIVAVNGLKLSVVPVAERDEGLGVREDAPHGA